MKATCHLLVVLAVAAWLLPARTVQAQNLFDNSFIHVAAGLNGTVLDPLHPGNLGFSADAHFGTWFNRIVGARIGINTGWNNTRQPFELQGIEANKPFGFHYAHADLLYSFTEDIGGIKEDRIWEVVVYAHTGALKIGPSRTPFSRGHVSWAGGLGMINEFRLTKEAGITLDLQGILAKSTRYTDSGEWIVLFPVASLGLTFYLDHIH